MTLTATTELTTARELARRVRDFVDTEIVPVESALWAGGAHACERLEELQRRARQQGLWGIGYPVELGGRGLLLTEYLLVAEQEGRSHFGPAVFGAESLVDAHMLHRFARPEVRERYLLPMVRGEMVPSFGMTEPGRTGSEPSGIRTRASQDDDGTWTVTGHKWFISNAGKASFMSVLARSEGLGKPANTGFSLIVVPTNADGFRVVRTQPVLGQFTGQCEIELSDVRVREHHVVGERGLGMTVVQERLGLARTVRGMHWLGQAQRGFDLMCQRMRRRQMHGGRLSDKQLMHQLVTESYLEISAARALLRRAAGRLESGQRHAVDLSVAKLAASRTAVNVLDRAIQVHGAEGLSDDTPLSSMYRAARATRIYDGADEVHVTTAAHRILKSYVDSDSYDFTDLTD
ncbi:MAG: acyl-CoA dehydrogenase family protein [Aldersonia sp.]|nr:acyl-CoA dehydrogenase family protein [Aldersonia sp.]